MLVIRKEYKVVVGVGAAILGVAALYGVMSLLSNMSSKSQQANNSTSTGEISTLTIPDSKTDNLPHGLDSAQQGLPPVEKTDTTVVIDTSKLKDADQFAESSRKDGKPNDDIWTTAWSTGKVSTSSNMSLPIKTIEPAKSGDFVDGTLPTRTDDKKSETTHAKSNNGAILATGTYVVQPGDNYSRIAGKLLGNKNLYSLIEKANPGIEPTKLKPGMTIKVPPASEAASLDRGAISTEPEVIGTIDTKNEYRVISGDTLHRIAQKLYGKTAMWQSIYDTNKQKIGPDAGKLKVGMLLALPQTPASIN